MVYWVVSAFGVKRSVREYNWKTGAYIRLAAAAGIVLVLHFHPAYASFADPGPILAVIGVLLAAAGIALCVWARRHLGRNWGMPMSNIQGAELITSGPYRLIRHPIYGGILLALFGTTLATSWSLLIVLAVVSVYFTYGALGEERRMIKLFPKDYPAYKTKSKMLVPFIF